MKKAIFVAIIIAASMFAQAQTVDEIINKHIAAMGGKEKLLSLKTVKITATNLNPQGLTVDVVFTHKHLQGFRLDRTRNGAKALTIVTPKKGWIFGFAEKIPTAMDDDQLKSSQDRLDIQGVLLNYKEKGKKIELVGKEKVEGIECYNLKMTDKNGIVNNYYIDCKTYRISKRKFGDNSTLYLNYKQNAGGFWFAYLNKNSNGLVQTFLKIETNIPIDDKIFQVDEGVF